MSTQPNPWQPNASDVHVTLCTVPNSEVAERIARELVTARLAACVNIVPGLRSIYSWQGKVCDDAELLLIIKTTHEQLETMASRIQQLHPYENPEVINVPVGGGLLAYLDWVRQETHR